MKYFTKNLKDNVNNNKKRPNYTWKEEYVMFCDSQLVGLRGGPEGSKMNVQGSPCPTEFVPKHKIVPKSRSLCGV